ncbi:MAG: hypothetical protein QF824_02485 [Candidatus Woesearchaeota archaeon]|jgi:hypothetical protein|nr:hypothetical protein [Candidatus Woesearchaeota archaeon]
MPRKTTSLKIDPDLWKEVKKKCIDLETEISDYLENLIKKDLNMKGSKEKKD